MHTLARNARNFLFEEEAVTSIEYALLGVLIAVVCVAAVKAVGTNLSALFTDVCNKVTEAVTGTPPSC
jgi:pilus assembly protein Flp/PilA